MSFTSCAACAATAPPSARMGSSRSSTTATVMRLLASLGRLPSRAASRAVAGASNAPSNMAQVTGCHRGVTMRQTRYSSPAISNSMPMRAKKIFCDAAACGSGRVIVASPTSSREGFMEFQCPVRIWRRASAAYRRLTCRVSSLSVSRTNRWPSGLRSTTCT